VIPVATVIQDKLQQYFDASYPTFIGWGTTDLEMLNRWADVIDFVLAGVVPVSLTSVAARAAFITTLTPGMGALGAFQVTLVSALQQYAIVLAAGMLPAFTGIPPVLPPAIVFTGLVTRSAATEMANLSVVLYTWAASGTAATLPSGTPIVPWI